MLPNQRIRSVSQRANLAILVTKTAKLLQWQIFCTWRFNQRRVQSKDLSLVVVVC